jgi:hypothetical protein
MNTLLLTLYALLFLASGAARGVVETLRHHYQRFINRLPMVNDQFWNPDDSWLNKYEVNQDYTLRPKFFGSTTLLAWTTDATHLFATISRVNAFCAFTLLAICGAPTGSDIELAGFLAMCAGAWWAGFHTVYAVIFK